MKILYPLLQKNPEKTLNVLKAFSFSKAPENRYLIINCFEAAVAIYFIDQNIIQQILDNKLITWNMIL